MNPHIIQKSSKTTILESLATITDAGLLAALVLAILLIGVGPVHAEPKPPPCTEDAMIVFDASGSMAGNLDQGIATLNQGSTRCVPRLRKFCRLSHTFVASASLPMVQARVSNVTSSLTSSRLSTLRVSSCARSTT